MTTERTMMRVGAVVALLFCCAVLTRAQAPPPPPPPVAEYNPNAWKEFASQEGRFSVKMPGEPKLDRRDLSGAGGTQPAYFYTAQGGAGVYTAWYTDFPQYSSEEPQFAGAVLDASRDKVLASDASRKLLSEKEVTAGGFKGREWLIADDRLLLRSETYLVKGRLYQLVLLAPLNVAFNNGRASANAADRTDLYEDVSKRFFGSFKLLPAGAAGGAPGR